MKKPIIFSILYFLTFSLFSQGFKSPPDSLAAVYFVRVSSYGGAASFEFFQNNKFIGIFKGKNYMRFEFNEGEHLLWASSENKEFIKCNFKAGEIYIVLVNIEMGAWKARVGLEPITVNNMDFERIKKVVNSKPPIITSQEKIKSTQAKLDDREFIKNILERYEKEWKNNKNTKTISSDMFIPKEKLQ